MYCYIVDLSAPGLGKTLQEKIRARLEELGILGEWLVATTSEEASRLASTAAANHTTVVAVGGDDTVNLLINALGDSDVAVGIIPVGTVNHLAAQLGISGWQQACDVLAARRLTPYNLIGAGQRFFLSTLTLGFEAELDKHIDRSPGNLRTTLQQLLAGYGRARQFGRLRARITLDNDLRLECDVFALRIESQRFLDASADNRLVVSLLERPGRVGLGGYLWRRFRQGGSTETPASSRFVVKRAVIETAPPTGLVIDGKVAGRTPIAIRLTERRVRFITEKAARTMS